MVCPEQGFDASLIFLNVLMLGCEYRCAAVSAKLQQKYC